PRIGSGMLFFPFAAFLVALSAPWLFGEETIRCRPTIFKYHKILGTYGFGLKGIAPKKSWWQSLSMVVVLLCSLGAAGLAIGDAWLLLKTMEAPPKSGNFLYESLPIKFYLASAIAVLVSIVFSIWLI